MVWRGCCDKAPKTGQLKQRHLLLRVLEAGRQDLGARRSGSCWETPGGSWRLPGSYTATFSTCVQSGISLVYECGDRELSHLLLYLQGHRFHHWGLTLITTLLSQGPRSTSVSSLSIPITSFSHSETDTCESDLLPFPLLLLFSL